MYDVSAAINNVEMVQLPLNSDFQIDIETLKPWFKDKRLKLLFICSPNNPTGNIIHRDTIGFILNNFNGIVIVDEAYIDFAEEKSMVKMVNEYNNLIISQTFSKAWGLAGARLGTAYACEELISLFNNVKSPYNVSILNQKAALEALDNIDLFHDNLAVILKEKKRVERLLMDMATVKKVYPSHANFILIEVDDANQLYNKLVAKNIIIRNRDKEVKNCLRISIGTPQENSELINALKNI